MTDIDWINLIKNDPSNLSKSPQTDEMIWTALLLDPDTIRYVKNKKYSMIYFLTRINPNYIVYMRNPPNELAQLLIDNNVQVLLYIYPQNKQICEYAIHKDNNARYYIRDFSLI